MVKWSFPGSLYFEKTRKNLKSNVVLVVVLVLESKGLSWRVEALKTLINAKRINNKIMKNDIKQIPRRSRTHEITGAIQPIRNSSRSTVSLDLERLIGSYSRRSFILITWLEDLVSVCFQCASCSLKSANIVSQKVLCCNVIITLMNDFYCTGHSAFSQ